MSKPEPPADLSDACALLAAYGAMTRQQRQALLGLALAMAPRDPGPAGAEWSCGCDASGDAARNVQL